MFVRVSQDAFRCVIAYTCNKQRDRVTNIVNSNGKKNKPITIKEDASSRCSNFCHCNQSRKQI